MNKNYFAAGLLSLSIAGATYIAQHEGTQTIAYADPVGIPTICTGHTGPEVRLGQQASFAECNRLLIKDTTIAGRAIARCTHVAITQQQYDALVSLVFNIGGGAYCTSTLVRQINAGNCLAAADQFDRWIYSRGKKLRGLITRRAAEAARFKADCPTPREA